MGLDASELARLLITREMRVRRLPQLTSGRTNAARGRPRKSGDTKLTAHFHLSENVDEFDAYAGARGMTRAAAARLIFERELREKWLAKAFAWTPKNGQGK
jgi:hypothetical protein